MAEYKAPYKNNTIKGIVGNVNAYGDYVEDEIGKAGVNALDSLVNATYDVSEKLYEGGKDTVNSVGKFFTGEAESNVKDATAPINTTPTAQVNGGQAPVGPVAFDKQGALDYANSIRQQQGQAQSTEGTQAQGTRATGGASGTGTPTNTQNANPYDKIASDLLSQGGTSTEDVVYYLAANIPGWNNYSETERVNMVNDILGRMSNQANGEQSQPETPSNALPSDYSNSVVQSMQNDFQASENDKIYGKVGAGQSEGIVANVDANSVYADAEQARIAKVQDFILQNPYAIAASFANGLNYYDEQTIADVKRYAPEYWNQVQAQLKNIQVEDTVNAIASGEPLPNTGADQIESVNTGVNNWAMSNSSTPQQAQYEIQNISNAMGYNQTAGTAKQEILNINAQIEEYKKKISNLDKEANAVFKGDAPAYLVAAYINNKTQKYQAEIEKLEGRRQSAFDVYKLEVSEYQNNRDYWLKYQQFQRDLNNDTWDRWYKEQQLNKANIHWENGKAYQVNSDGTISQLSDATALYAYQADVQNTINGYKSLYTSGGGTKTATGYKYGVCGLECEGFTDMFTESTTGLTMLPRDENGNIIKGRSWTYAKEKMDYCNTWTPVVGSIAVGVGGVYDSTYGHTMLVTGWDPNTQMVELLWSNKDGDKTIYSTTDTLSNLYAKGLYGFWDPYKDMAAQNAGYSVGYDVNGNYITPMTETFDRLISDATTSGQREDIGRAEQGYDFLYELTHDNDLYNSGQASLDVFVDSGDLAKVLNYLSKENFEKSSSDEGNTFMSLLNDYKNKYMAKEFAGGVQSEKALTYLIQLVELKLRNESGAVINSGEWATNFNNLLPMPGESKERQYDKMKSWDAIILRQLRGGGFDKKSDYIPIFSESTVREIW